MRGETNRLWGCSRDGRISIHSPRAGRDSVFYTSLAGMSDFNPLSPCGERRIAKPPSKKSLKFQSTLPVRGETVIGLHLVGRDPQFQSTLPVRGETDIDSLDYLNVKNFNPLSPCGERQVHVVYTPNIYLFQSTLPVRGETYPR